MAAAATAAETAVAEMEEAAAAPVGTPALASGATPPTTVTAALFTAMAVTAAGAGAVAAEVAVAALALVPASTPAPSATRASVVAAGAATAAAPAPAPEAFSSAKLAAGGLLLQLEQEPPELLLAWQQPLTLLTLLQHGGWVSAAQRHAQTMRDGGQRLLDTEQELTDNTPESDACRTYGVHACRPTEGFGEAQLRWEAEGQRLVFSWKAETDITSKTDATTEAVSRALDKRLDNVCIAMGSRAEAAQAAAEVRMCGDNAILAQVLAQRGTDAFCKEQGVLDQELCQAHDREAPIARPAWEVMRASGDQKAFAAARLRLQFVQRTTRRTYQLLTDVWARWNLTKATASTMDGHLLQLLVRGWTESLTAAPGIETVQDRAGEAWWMLSQTRQAPRPGELATEAKQNELAVNLSLACTTEADPRGQEAVRAVEDKNLDTALHGALLLFGHIAAPRRLETRLRADLARHFAQDRSTPSAQMEEDRTTLLIPAMAMVYLAARFDQNLNACAPDEFKRKWLNVLQKARCWGPRRGGQCCLNCRIYATLLQGERAAHDLAALAKHLHVGGPNGRQAQRAGYTGSLRATGHELIHRNRLVLYDEHARGRPGLTQAYLCWLNDTGSVCHQPGTTVCRADLDSSFDGMLIVFSGEAQASEAASKFTSLPVQGAYERDGEAGSPAGYPGERAAPLHGEFSSMPDAQGRPRAATGRTG